MPDGSSCGVETEIPVLRSAGAGLQSLSSMQVGGLQSITGSVVDVDATQVTFSLPEEIWPNNRIRVLCPLVTPDSSVHAVEIDLADDGRAMLNAPKALSEKKATMSLSGLHYVRLEVDGAIKLDES